MFDSTVEWLGHPMYMKMYADKQIPRVGLGHAAIVPYDSYPTADGEILIGVQNDRGWRALMVDVFEREDLVDHPRYRTNIVRVENRGEVDELVGSLTRLYSTTDLDQRLAAAGVPAAALNDMAGLLEHPQLEKRARWRSVGTENGPIDAVLPPMTYSDVEMSMGDVPALGSRRILCWPSWDLRATGSRNFAATDRSVNASSVAGSRTPRQSLVRHRYTWSRSRTVPGAGRVRAADWRGSAHR